MKVIISCLNSKFVHASLSPWCLLAGLRKFSKKTYDASVLESTINGDTQSFAYKIINEKPDVVAFSCYIWNITKTLEICRIIKQNSDCKIVLGGPEVAYRQKDVLLKYEFIMTIGGFFMSFSSISIKEAIENINATHNGWFLPAVQRPYVWGSRYESEKYICKLFDSILRGYPIGTLIVWNSDKEIPYRHFMENYHDGQVAEFADKSLWNRNDKWLVYDGQQRLQTLFSCLKFAINNRILTYNLFFDVENSADAEENGFEFADKNDELKPGYISIPNLFIQLPENKVEYRNKIKSSIPVELLKNKEAFFEKVIDNLWDVFIRKEVKSLAFFPIESTWSEERVNDVFQRLNTGGVPLSGADLLLSKIKEKNYDFEERLQRKSSQIFDLTNGYDFSVSSILQLIHLIVKNTPRIDPDRIYEKDIQEFIRVAEEIDETLDDFFKYFIADGFKINNSAILIRGLALLPLITYVFNRRKHGVKYGNIEAENIIKMKQYFILSQLNDWNTQGIVSESAKYTFEHSDFPLEQIKSMVVTKNRVSELSITALESYFWFPLKILLPNRLFPTATTRGRYKLELDHIFPIHLKDRPQNYEVNVLWNLQPVTGKINAEKSNKHPVEFFRENKSSTYISEYDFIPDDLNNDIWKSHEDFINYRKEKMIEFFTKEYRIKLT